MTSIVVSEVHHSLPYSAHHQHRRDYDYDFEARSRQQQQHNSHSAHSRQQPHYSNTDAPASATYSSVGESMDTPMTDAAPNHPQPSADATPSQPAPTHNTATPLEPPPSSNAAPQHVRMEAPPSPHIRGQSQPTPRAIDPPQTSKVVPSSNPSPHDTPGSQDVPSLVHSPTKVKVKSLSHIQSFVLDEQNPLSQAGSRLARRDTPDTAPQYEISEMPVTDIIEMVAGLLTKITTTNDKQHQHLHRQPPPPEGGPHMNPQTASVLAFHGKNVPSISILSYLSRIHKYCPTTYEVFLSLLVYFDRMTERVNAGPLQNLKQHQQHTSEAERSHDGSRHSSVSSAALAQDSPQQPSSINPSANTNTPPPSGSLGQQQPQHQQTGSHGPDSPPSPPLDEDPYNFSHFFVVDSYNIHRLVIAGVTCASKFFSDIFYTNSRYAKVGGLPLPELNHLELQFLLLNDFRLAVPLEEMEAYGTMLVEFYAREVLANQGPQ